MSRDQAVTKDEKLKELYKAVRVTVPKPASSDHKGSSGRVAVLGGCSGSVSGATYFAATTALKLGVDLAYVICVPDSALPIKAAAPDLIVNPILGDSKSLQDDEDVQGNATEIVQALERTHAILIGPGVGSYDSRTHDVIAKVVDALIQKNKPLVLDGDVFQIMVTHPSVFYALQGYRNAVLTPNEADLRTLRTAVRKHLPDSPLFYVLEKERIASANVLAALQEALNGPTFLYKGEKDLVYDWIPDTFLLCRQRGSPRRCGGLGSILSGVVLSFLCWHALTRCSASPTNLCFCSAAITRVASKISFEKYQHSMLASTVMDNIYSAFECFLKDSTLFYEHSVAA